MSFIRLNIISLNASISKNFRDTPDLAALNDIIREDEPEDSSWLIVSLEEYTKKIQD